MKGTSLGNVSGCTDYPPIYAAAFANQAGPADRGTAQCIFLLSFTSQGSSGSKKTVVVVAVVVVVVVTVSVLTTFLTALIFICTLLTFYHFNHAITVNAKLESTVFHK